MDIWVRELRRDVATRLTFHEALDLRPVWSPDGTRIAFFSDRDGAPTIYQKPANGAGEAEPLFEATEGRIGPFWPSHWSRDGRYLVYTELGSPVNVFALPLQGDREPIPVAQSEFTEALGSLSPDGAWIAYGSNESGSVEIYARPFPEGQGRWQVSTDGGLAAVWSEDGGEIFYLSATGTRSWLFQSRAVPASRRVCPRCCSSWINRCPPCPRLTSPPTGSSLSCPSLVKTTQTRPLSS